MKKFATSLAVAATVALGASAASASFIDFTDENAFGGGIVQVNSTTLTGTAASGWTGVATGGDLTFAQPGPGEQGGLIDGENDGLGIGRGDDEITFGAESFTITFNSIVTIEALYFLDHFSPEEVHLAVDGTDQAPFISTVPNPGVGFTSFDGLSLTGTVFTFTVGEPNEVGFPDYSLAAIDLAPIPLPAGVLLLGGALGALGVARRRRKAA